MTPQQIKFRGFRTDGKGWVEGDLIQDKSGNKWIIPIEEFSLTHMVAIHPESLGMFTGLTDKNGREIFGAIGNKGGDVVKVDKSHYVFGSVRTGSIFYTSQSARFHLMGTTYDNLFEALFDIPGKNFSEIINNQWEDK